MTTVLDIITEALQEANIIAADEVPNASDGQKGFRVLNRMLAADTTENMMIFNNVSEVFTLTSQQTYTMGAGGDFNTTRPVEITAIYVRDTNGNDIPVQMVSYEEYASIISKPVTSSIPLVAWCNASFPLYDITLWPVPASTTWRLVVWSWKAFTSYTSVTDAVTLPPGYEDYMVYNLAQRLCISYGRPVPAELSAMARDSKAVVKRINEDVPTLSLPAAISNNVMDSTFPISPHILTGY